MDAANYDNDGATCDESNSAPPDADRTTRLGQVSDLATALAQTMWQQARDRERDGWPPWWLALFVILVAATVVVFVVVPLLQGIGALLADLVGWVHHYAYAQIVLSPIHRYLSAHADGLPVNAATLWLTWCLAGGLLLLLSFFRSVGARIGWTLYGAASMALVANGTAGPGRWIATGVGGLWWSLLSIAALRRRRPVPEVRVIGPPPTVELPAAADPMRPAPDSTQRDDGEQDDPQPDDAAAWAARLYETSIRRGHLAGLSEQRWTVTTHGVNGFTAVAVDGRRAGGIAVSSEAVQELLAGLSTTPGARPYLDWTTTPPAVPRSRRMNFDDLQGPGPIREFVVRSTDTLTQLAAVLRERRRSWPSGDADLEERIISRAAALNRASPVVRATSFMPASTDWQANLGVVILNDWVPTDTIVAGGGAASWNDFASHRPARVAQIIQKLLAAADPGQALAEILTDLGHVHVSRYHGPAGPIHNITVNGTHRTHALRLLDVPLVAAEVTVDPLPVRLNVFSTSADEGWGDNRHHGPTVTLWRSLMSCNLLTGRITGAGFDAVLEAYQVAAPWLLCSPRDAATISAAYERRYPGTLGIPIEAMAGPAQWCKWLLGSPYPPEP